MSRQGSAGARRQHRRRKAIDDEDFAGKGKSCRIYGWSKRIDVPWKEVSEVLGHREAGPGEQSARTAASFALHGAAFEQ